MNWFGRDRAPVIDTAPTPPDDRPRCTACNGVDVALTTTDIGCGYGAVVVCADDNGSCSKRAETNRVGIFGGVV